MDPFEGSFGNDIDCGSGWMAAAAAAVAVVVATFGLNWLNLVGVYT